MEEARPSRPSDRPQRRNRRRSRKRPRRLRWTGTLLALIVSLIAADAIVEYALDSVPLPRNVRLGASSRVYDRNGELISTYRGSITRFIIDTTRLPDHVRQAVIAAEDKDFYAHEGLSLTGMARAAWANFTSGRIAQGGSTLTQQYIKNVVLRDTSRTISRKLKEAILAIKLERQYSKDEILDRYLNAVYFGRGAYGIEAAARAYFGKHATRLKPAEAAYLAALIPSPESYQPNRNYRAAIERRNHVLSVMREEGYITSEQEQHAARSKLRLKTSPELRREHQQAAYFLEWLRKEYLYPRFGSCLYTCGLKIHTTLDLGMQAAAEQAVASTLDEKGDPPAALVSMTPNGRVRAFVGGPAFTNVRKARGYDFASDGGRSPGSAFKPFTLLAAIENNISTNSGFTGQSPKLIDDPACSGPDGLWEPENYGGSSYGYLTLEDATVNSVNTVYAELIAEIGPENVAGLVERFGFDAPDGGKQIAPNCSLALGTLDVSVLEMARAYAGFAGRGRLPEVVPIRYVEDRDGNCLLGFGTPEEMDCKKRISTVPEQVVDANWADVLTRTLTGVIEGGTATGAQIGRPAAGKTGTTQNNRDAWFAGYVPQLTTVVWMGYPIEPGPDRERGTADDISPLMGYCSPASICRPVHGIEVVGGTFPATIWASYMAAVLEDFQIEYFTEPIDEPDIVLNPPPPPPEPEKKDDNKKDDNGDDGNGHGRHDRG